MYKKVQVTMNRTYYTNQQVKKLEKVMGYKPSGRSHILFKHQVNMYAQLLHSSWTGLL